MEETDPEAEGAKAELKKEMRKRLDHMFATRHAFRWTPPVLKTAKYRHLYKKGTNEVACHKFGKGQHSSDWSKGFKRANSPTRKPKCPCCSKVADEKALLRSDRDEKV